MFCHFKQRTVPGAFYSLPGNWNFFSLRKFCKDLSKWKSKGVMSGECGEWIRTSQPSCKFLPGHQSNMWSCIILMLFLLTNSRCFFLSSAFSCLIGSSICWNCLIFWKELIIALPSSATICKTTSSLDEDQPFVWLVVGHFTCSMISSVPHYYTVQYPLFITCFKMKTFSLCFSRELHVEI